MFTSHELRDEKLKPDLFMFRVVLRYAAIVIGRHRCVCVFVCRSLLFAFARTETQSVCRRRSRTPSLFPNVNSGYVRRQRLENHRSAPLKSKHAILAAVFLLGEETVLEQRLGFPNCLWNDVNCLKSDGVLFFFCFFFEESALVRCVPGRAL